MILVFLLVDGWSREWEGGGDAINYEEVWGVSWPVHAATGGRKEREYSVRLLYSGIWKSGVCTSGFLRDGERQEGRRGEERQC